MKYNDFVSWVDVPKFAGICNEIANATVLNERTNRMMKEKFIIAAMQLSNTAKNIDWVDEQDYDVKFNAWTDGEIEVKTGNDPLFTEEKGNLKKTIDIKLKNVHESKNQRTTLDKTFDHLMIIQIKNTFGIGFVDYATVVANLDTRTDGFKLIMPGNLVNIIYKQDIKNTPSNWTIDFDPKNWIMHQLTSAGC